MKRSFFPVVLMCLTISCDCRCSNSDQQSVAGVLVSDSGFDGANVFSATAQGQNGTAITGAIGSNSSVSGSGVFNPDEKEAGTVAGSVTGSGVISVASGSGTSFASLSNGSITAYSKGNNPDDSNLALVSHGNGQVAADSNDRALSTGKVMVKSETASASGTGAVVSSTISSKDASAVGTLSSKGSTAAGSVGSSGGVGSALGFLTTGGHGTRGSAASGSVSGGAAVTSLSASPGDYDYYSSSISAISARMLPMSNRSGSD